MVQASIFITCESNRFCPLVIGALFGLLGCLVPDRGEHADNQNGGSPYMRVFSISGCQMALMASPMRGTVRTCRSTAR